MERKSYVIIEPVTKRIVTLKGGNIGIGKVGDKPLIFNRWLNSIEIRDEINKGLTVEYAKRKSKIKPNYFINYEVNNSGYVHLVGQNEWLYVGGVA